MIRFFPIHPGRGQVGKGFKDQEDDPPAVGKLFAKMNPGEAVFSPRLEILTLPE
jgi:hypothetical protein